MQITIGDASNETNNANASNTQTTASTGVIANPFRFAGQYYDIETNTNYNYHRQYDPSGGNYTQTDPIGLAGGLNRQGYVNQNPIKLIDPSGLTIYGGPAGSGIYQDRPPTTGCRKAKQFKSHDIYGWEPCEPPGPKPPPAPSECPGGNGPPGGGNPAPGPKPPGIPPPADPPVNPGPVDGGGDPPPCGGARLPDFVTWSFNVNLGLITRLPLPPWLDITIAGTLDRYGNQYLGGGIGGGRANESVSASLSASWVLQKCKPNEADLSEHISGFGVAAAAGRGLGAQGGYSPGDGKFDAGIGIYSPQYGVSAGVTGSPTRSGFGGW